MMPIITQIKDFLCRVFGIFCHRAAPPPSQPPDMKSTPGAPETGNGEQQPNSKQDGTSSTTPESTEEGDDTATPEEQSEQNPDEDNTDANGLATVEQTDPPDDVNPDGKNTAETDDGVTSNTPPPNKKNKPTKPREISPVRDTKQDSGTKPTPAAQKPTPPKAELICRENRGKFNLYLVLPDNYSAAEMRHGDLALNPESRGEYCLKNFSGNLSVDTADEPTVVPLFDGNTPLIFKMQKNWEGEGRQMPRIARGYYIVVAPHSWKRTGDCPVAKEYCLDEGFAFHFFYADKSTDAIDVGGFVGYPSLVGKTRIDLSGHQIFDDSDEGVLFGGDPPVLKNATNITQAQLIAEDSRGKFQYYDFNPREKSIADILDGRQGHFFIRVYEEDGKQIDREEFRYCPGLRAIKVNGADYMPDTPLLPATNGHKTTRIEFAGDASLSSVVEAEPREDCDIVEREIRGVKIVVQLPRVWWQLDDGEESRRWQDTPIETTREQFRHWAENEFVLRLKLPHSVRKFSGGLDGKFSTSYPTKDGISLFAFGSYQKLRGAEFLRDVMLQVCINGQTTPLVRVKADVPQCHKDNEKPDDQKVSKTPDACAPAANALVRRGPRRRLYLGKGFSRAELAAAKISERDIMSLRLSVDERRNTAYPVNIKTLEREKHNYANYNPNQRVD